jgi:phosphoribosylanthranilate isomerase
MTWVKICGTTSIQDARLAVDAGANALGFVFAESPRRVTAEQARAIIAALPEPVEKVGVFVNEAVEQMLEFAHQARLTAIQLHGEEPAGVMRAIKQRLAPGARLRVIRSIPVPESSGGLDGMGWDPFVVGVVEVGGDGKPVPSDAVDALLFDSGSPRLRGGTGKPFDWKGIQPLLRSISALKKVVVAGGLNPANVGEAIRLLQPWGVDVVSGVEREPGKKDPEKVRAFIAAVRQADKDHARL